MRTLKIVRTWKRLQRLIKVVAQSINQIGSLAILIMLFSYIYAILGYQLFYETPPGIDPDEEYYSFSNFPNSLITIWILLTAENCNIIMYERIH